MAKGMNSKKAEKKEPAKTPKEKKEEKREKMEHQIDDEIREMTDEEFKAYETFIATCPVVPDAE